MNFWEARQAALDGKNVRIASTEGAVPYNKKDFEEYSWGPGEMSAEWEMVEPPTVHYLIPFANGLVCHWHAKERAIEYMKSAGGLTVIEVLINKDDGQLLSARHI